MTKKLFQRVKKKFLLEMAKLLLPTLIDHRGGKTLLKFIIFLHLDHVNACVANGGWVLKDLGTDPNNPNPGWWDTP